MPEIAPRRDQPARGRVPIAYVITEAGRRALDEAEAHPEQQPKRTFWGRRIHSRNVRRAH